MVSTFAPAKDGNNVEKYTNFLREKTGIFDNKAVKDFSPDEFDKLWRAIEQMEASKPGDITEVFPITHVHKNKNGIFNLNVEKNGWISKSECIAMAKKGSLDLVVCTSNLGHDYLRAREGSSVNGSLEHLVVKNNEE